MTENPAALFSTALQQHRAGSLPQAAELYRRVLQQQPNHAEALHSLGVIACQSGNLAEGIACYQQALAIAPQMADAHHNLATAFQLTGNGVGAIAHYRTALSLQPSNATAHNNLGSLLMQQGDLPTGIGHFRQALAIQPNYPSALLNLGVALTNSGNGEEAIAPLQYALQLQPTLLQARHTLGHIYNCQGRFDEAIPQFQQVLAVQLHPSTCYSLGKALEEQGNTAAAIAQFRQALQLQPTYVEANWHQHLVLPVLYDSAAQILQDRQRFCRELNALIHQTDLTTPEGRMQALQGSASRTNFYLAYQGLNDRGLQQKYGRFIHRIMAASFPQWAGEQKLGEQGDGGMGRQGRNGGIGTQGKQKAGLESGQRRMRIGYLSAHLMAHSAAAWARGWMRERDRDRFQVYCYHVGSHRDGITREFHDLSDVFRHLPTSLEAICEQVLGDQLDVLIFTDLGMDPKTTQLAALRLAPVQCTAWGHPVTSGLPTIDYYLSSDRMEPASAQQHYTETLVRLPNIGICYSKPPLPAVERPRSHFGLRENAIVYLCFQSPYKYLPQYDRLFAQIAQQVANAQFVFLRHSSKFTVERFQHRLQQAFAEFGLRSSDYCVFLPKLDRDSYWSLNQRSDVFLDSLDWSGGNSTLEAVAYGLPVVTRPGKLMRGRHSSAILQQLGVTATIAQTEAEYVDIAVRLGLDAAWRRTISAQIQAGHAQLYDDTACVRGLEDFFIQVGQR